MDDEQQDYIIVLKKYNDTCAGGLHDFDHYFFPRDGKSISHIDNLSLILHI